MHVKKEAVKRMVEMVDRKIQKLNWKKKQHVYEMKKIVESQKITKKEIAYWIEMKKNFPKI